MLMKVVLPAPLEPMMHLSSPAAMAKSMSLLAINPRNRLDSLCVRNSSAMAGTPLEAPPVPTLDRAGDAAAEKNDDEDKERAEDERPVGGNQRTQVVRQERNRDRGKKGAQEAGTAADRHPYHDL